MGFPEKLFIEVLNMGITASYVILAVLVIRFFIGKAPKKFSYYLWAVVGFRLLCPFSFSSIISIFNLKLFSMQPQNNTGYTGTLNYIPTEVGTMPVPKVTVGIPAADHVINNTLPAATPIASINPMQVIVFTGTLLWIIGIAAFLIYGIVSYLRVRRQVAKAVYLKGNIYECDQISTPFVLGVVNPRIYVPFHLGEKEMDYILRHEQYHIRRKDYLIKPLSYLLLIIYWFNPMVWAAYLCMSKDMEMSCDEKVIGEMGFSVKNAYSMSLLSFAANNRFPVASPLAFGETNTKKRIKNILRFKKANWGLSVVIGLLCLIAVLAFAANPLHGKDSIEIVPSSASAEDQEISELARQLYENKNPYIGDAPADGKLLQVLGIQNNIGDYTLELETSQKPYVLKINFTDAMTDIGATDNKMIDYATVLLALIDNSDEIRWSYPEDTNVGQALTTAFWNEDNVKQMGIEKIKSYSKSAEKVQELLDKIESLNQTELGSGKNNNKDIRLQKDSAIEVTPVPEAGMDTDNGYTIGTVSGTASKELTIDDVLAQKDWSSLTYDYFNSYDNKVEITSYDEGVLNDIINIQLNYEGKPFTLQVSYMKADYSIDYISLINNTNNDTLLLYSVNPLYKVDTDVASFLQKNVSMDMYLTYTLPEGYVNGPYDALLWLGGNFILKAGEQPSDLRNGVNYNYPDSTPSEWFAPGAVMRIPASFNDVQQSVTFENGTLVRGDLHNNHSWYISDPVILSNTKEQGVLMEANHDLYTAPQIYDAEQAGNPIPTEDQTSQIWEMYFAREGSEIAYCIFLNEKYFTKEQAIALAESVQFTDTAFEK